MAQQEGSRPVTQTLTPPSAVEPDSIPEQPESLVRTLINRISRLEIAIGALIAVILLALVIIEPNILEAPFENANTILFTLGGTLIAGLAFVAMLWGRVPPVVRVVVLVVPFAIVNWWLLSPYFIDDVVDEEFATSISAQLATPAEAAAPAAAPTRFPTACSWPPTTTPSFRPPPCCACMSRASSSLSPSAPAPRICSPTSSWPFRFKKKASP